MENKNEYKYTNLFNDEITCLPFTSGLPNFTGVEIFVNGERAGILVGENIPNEESGDFEATVEVWLNENGY